jgi:hypothetical protein
VTTKEFFELTPLAEVAAFGIELPSAELDCLVDWTAEHLRWGGIPSRCRQPTWIFRRCRRWPEGLPLGFRGLGRQRRWVVDEKPLNVPCRSMLFEELNRALVEG